MPGYIARVEIHSGTADDYERLHAAMQSIGYLRTIRADDGTIYRLPTGLYQHPGIASTAPAQRDIVMAVAEGFHSNPMVLISDWATAAWALPPV